MHLNKCMRVDKHTLKASIEETNLLQFNLLIDGLLYYDRTALRLSEGPSRMSFGGVK